MLVLLHNDDAQCVMYTHPARGTLIDVLKSVNVTNLSSLSSRGSGGSLSWPSMACLENSVHPKEI